MTGKIAGEPGGREVPVAPISIRSKRRSAKKAGTPLVPVAGGR